MALGVYSQMLIFLLPNIRPNYLFYENEVI